MQSVRTSKVHVTIHTTRIQIKDCTHRHVHASWSTLYTSGVNREMLDSPSPRRSDASKKRRAVGSAAPRRKLAAWAPASLLPNPSSPMSRLSTRAEPQMGERGGRSIGKRTQKYLYIHVPRLLFHPSISTNVGSFSKKQRAIRQPASRQCSAPPRHATVLTRARQPAAYVRGRSVSSCPA